MVERVPRKLSSFKGTLLEKCTTQPALYSRLSLYLELFFAQLEIFVAIYPEQHFRVVHVAPGRVAREGK